MIIKKGRKEEKKRFLMEFGRFKSVQLLDSFSKISATETIWQYRRYLGQNIIQANLDILF